MTAIKLQDLTRAKLAPSHYVFSAPAGEKFNVEWNWTAGADRWLWNLIGGEMNGEGRTLDLVKKGIVENLNTVVVAEPKPKHTRSRKEGGSTDAPSTRKARPSRAKALTEESEALFQTLANSAGDWNGIPLFEGGEAQKGNLTDLKRKGLVTTQEDEGCVFVSFTDKGRAYAEQQGITLMPV